MENMEEVSFQMIAAIGEARSKIMQAMDFANEEDFELAQASLNQAKEKLVVAHDSHFNIIQQEASGKEVKLQLLFVHAEDQLMTTSMLKDVAEQFVKVYKKISKLN